MPLTTVSQGLLSTDAQYTGFKNRIINGNMTIAQRGTGAISNDAAQNVFPVDRFGIYGSVSSKFTGQQNAGSVTPPVGFTNYLGCTSSSAYTVGAGELNCAFQLIEGFNSADLQWGTANAKTVTLSAWVRSSLTGTFGGSILNSTFNRSYPFTYSIPVANTWTQISVTIAGDTTGTWVGATNGIGIRVFFNLGSGSTVSGTAGAWAAGTFYAPSGAVSVVGTSGATWFATGIQLEVGSSATSFDYRPYGTELNLCMRYYNRVTFNIFAPGFSDTSTGFRCAYAYPVQMRGIPTLETTGTGSDYGVRSAGVSFINCNSVPTITGPGNSTTRIDVSVASGLVTGYGGFLGSSGSSTFLGFNAEL